MFILSIFLVISLGGFITNKLAGISDDSSDAYEYSVKDSKLLISIMLVGIILQALSMKLEVIKENYWLFVAFYILASIIMMISISQYRQIRLAKKQQDLRTVYEILQPLIDKKGVFEEFDTKQLKIDYEGNNVSRITIPLAPSGYNEEIAANCIMVMNKYLNYYEWLLEPKYEDRIAVFEGAPLPPSLANYKGSHLRPTNFMPVGVGSVGEIGWPFDSIKKKDLGESCYIGEDGKPIGYEELPSSPQSLVVGTTGSGKAIWIDQEIYD